LVSICDSSLMELEDDEVPRHGGGVHCRGRRISSSRTGGLGAYYYSLMTISDGRCDVQTCA